jgi:uncharacterized protein YndB with AHSA1/START domain
MNNRFATHDTFVVERVYNTNRECVFAAWSDPTIKSQWFQKAKEFDFRVGGLETNQGGPPGGPVYRFNARYEEIVPNQRIVYTYTMDMGETRISVSVTTVEFKQEESETRLIFTEQGTFLDGHDSAEAREHGTKIMLDKLGEVLKHESMTEKNQ